MVHKLRLPEKQTAQLRQFVTTVDPQKLKSLLGNLQDTRSLPINPVRIRRLFSSEIGPENAAILFPAVLGLVAYAYRHDIDHDELVSAFTRGLNTKAWSTDELDRWNDISETFLGIVGSDTINITAKVLDLSVAYDSLTSRTSIVTDVRPVYSRDRSDIVAFMPFSTIEFTTVQSDDEQIRLVIGYDELQRLTKQCLNAVKKLEVIKRSIEQLGKNVYFLGHDEEDDE